MLVSVKTLKKSQWQTADLFAMSFNCKCLHEGLIRKWIWLQWITQGYISVEATVHVITQCHSLLTVSPCAQRCVAIKHSLQPVINFISLFFFHLIDCLAYKIGKMSPTRSQGLSLHLHIACFVRPIVQNQILFNFQWFKTEMQHIITSEAGTREIFDLICRFAW